MREVFEALLDSQTKVCIAVKTANEAIKELHGEVARKCCTELDKHAQGVEHDLARVHALLLKGDGNSIRSATKIVGGYLPPPKGKTNVS